MAEKQPQTEGQKSKYFNMIKVIIAGLLVFGGPYLAFLMSDVLDMSYTVSMASGLIVLTIGLLITFYFARKGVFR